MLIVSWLAARMSARFSASVVLQMRKWNKAKESWLDIWQKFPFMLQLMQQNSTSSFFSSSSSSSLISGFVWHCAIRVTCSEAARETDHHVLACHSPGHFGPTNFPFASLHSTPHSPPFIEAFTWLHFSVLPLLPKKEEEEEEERNQKLNGWQPLLAFNWIQLTIHSKQKGVRPFSSLLFKLHSKPTAQYSAVYSTFKYIQSLSLYHYSAYTIVQCVESLTI